MTENELRAYQREKARERREQLAKLQQEEKEYKESEEYKRDCWEHQQDMWERKAKKEGWTYKRQPYVSALDRQKMQEQEKQQEIAYLEEKIKALKGE